MVMKSPLPASGAGALVRGGEVAKLASWPGRRPGTLISWAPAGFLPCRDSANEVAKRWPLGQVSTLATPVRRWQSGQHPRQFPGSIVQRLRAPQIREQVAHLLLRHALKQSLRHQRLLLGGQ